MKIKITHADGHTVELDGTADECAAFYRVTKSVTFKVYPGGSITPLDVGRGLTDALKAADRKGS